MSQLTPDETLLGLLAARPQHGYQLLECFQDPIALGRVWKLSTSQLYAVLNRLSAKGFIAGNELTSVDAPPRVEYRVTERGQIYLRQWLDEELPSPSIRRVRVEFLSRLYISRMLSLPPTAIIERQRRSCQQRRTKLVTETHEATTDIGRLAAQLEVAQLDAVLGWIDQCESVNEIGEG